MKISIIIPVFNEEENIEKLLNSIKKNKIKNKEIIIVDDDSTDNTREILKKFGSFVKCVHIKKSGVARARNVGIRYSQGSLIFFFDGDVILKKNTLKSFIKCFKENKKLNILQGHWNKTYPAETNFITKHILLKINHNIEEKFKSEKKYFNFKGIKVSDLSTGCLALRRKVLKNIKFNENYKHAGGEEFEMGSRLIDKYDIFYSPKIKVFHKFENIFITLRRIFFRSINYSVLIFNYRRKKTKNLSKSNETVVPRRDIVNTLIVFFFLLSFLALLINIKFTYLVFSSLILFFLNNLKLLIYIKNNLSLISMIKSYFVQLVITLTNIAGIMIAILLIYLIGYRGYKY